MLNSYSKYMIKMRKFGIFLDVLLGLLLLYLRGRIALLERILRRRSGRWTSWRSNWLDIFLRYYSYYVVCFKCKESKGLVFINVK